MEDGRSWRRQRTETLGGQGELPYNDRGSGGDMEKQGSALRRSPPEPAGALSRLQEHLRPPSKAFKCLIKPSRAALKGLMSPSRASQGGTLIRHTHKDLGEGKGASWTSGQGQGLNLTRQHKASRGSIGHFRPYTNIKTYILWSMTPPKSGSFPSCSMQHPCKCLPKSHQGHY